MASEDTSTQGKVPLEAEEGASAAPAVVESLEDAEQVLEMLKQRNGSMEAELERFQVEYEALEAREAELKKQSESVQRRLAVP